MNDSFVSKDFKNNTPTFGEEDWRSRGIKGKNMFETIQRVQESTQEDPKQHQIDKFNTSDNPNSSLSNGNTELKKNKVEQTSTKVRNSIEISKQNQQQKHQQQQQEEEQTQQKPEVLDSFSFVEIARPQMRAAQFSSESPLNKVHSNSTQDSFEYISQQQLHLQPTHYQQLIQMNPIVAVHPKISKRSPLFQKFGHNTKFSGGDISIQQQQYLLQQSHQISPNKSQSDISSTLSTGVSPMPLPTKALQNLNSKSIAYPSSRSSSTSVTPNQSTVTSPKYSAASAVLDQQKQPSQPSKQQPFKLLQTPQDSPNSHHSLWTDNRESQLNQRYASHSNPSAPSFTTPSAIIAAQSAFQSSIASSQTTRKNSDSSTQQIKSIINFLPTIKNQQAPNSPIAGGVIPSIAPEIAQIRESYSYNPRQITNAKQQQLSAQTTSRPSHNHNRNFTIDTSMITASTNHTPLKASSPIKRNRYDVFTNESSTPHTASSNIISSHRILDGDKATLSSRDISLDEIKINPISFALLQQQTNGIPDTLANSKLIYPESERGTYRSGRSYMNGKQAPQTASTHFGSLSTSHEIIADTKKKLQSANQAIRESHIQVRQCYLGDSKNSYKNYFDFSEPNQPAGLLSKKQIQDQQHLKLVQPTLEAKSHHQQENSMLVNLMQNTNVRSNRSESAHIDPHSSLIKQITRSVVTSGVSSPSSASIYLPISGIQRNSQQQPQKILQQNQSSFIQNNNGLQSNQGTYLSRRPFIGSIEFAQNHTKHETSSSKKANSIRGESDSRVSVSLDLNPSLQDMKQVKKRLNNSELGIIPNQQDIENLYNPGLTRKRTIPQVLPQESTGLATEQICSKIQDIFMKQKHIYDNSTLTRQKNPDETFLFRELNTALEELKGIPNIKRKQSTQFSSEATI